MKKSLLVLLVIVFFEGCNSQAQRKTLDDFVPKGHLISEKIFGDLDKDGLEDCVLITKGTDPGNVINDEYQGEVDRNRRGIVILFKADDGYRSIITNEGCFSSENEDGGVYFPPELSIDIERGMLYIHYSHGRYGYWKYTFRYQNDDFELIGYDSSSSNGPVVSRETSINFSTKKKLTKVNTYTSSELEDPIFDETWEDIAVEKLIRLSEIEDLDELDLP